MNRIPLTHYISRRWRRAATLAFGPGKWPVLVRGSSQVSDCNGEACVSYQLEKPSDLALPMEGKSPEGFTK
jgi:hypothetical protein